MHKGSCDFFLLSLISWEEISSQNILPLGCFSYKNDMTCFGMEFDKIDGSIWFNKKTHGLCGG